MVKLKIEGVSAEEIITDFSRIADDLFNNYVIQVNRDEFRMTEIEFYYFHDKNHRDIYTHPHQYEKSLWRFHSQGLDITFPSDSDEKTDGGILIRGLKWETGNIDEKSRYVNGPKKILSLMFSRLDLIAGPGNIFGLVHKSRPNKVIPKSTTRFGLNKDTSEFHRMPYRFYVDEDIPEKNKVKYLGLENN